MAAAVAAAIAISGLRIAVRQWTLDGGVRSMIDVTASVYAAVSRLVNEKKKICL